MCYSVCRQPGQKQNKLIALATSSCTEKGELRTVLTYKNVITCSTEYRQKMKEQSTRNRRAEITFIRLLFQFAIKSKLPQTDE